MLTLNDGRSELWQWDTGRKLTVDSDCSQVHFSNKIFGRSIDVDVVDGVAVIPDIPLQTDKDLNVWAFVGTAENGYTKISKTFKVNRRNKPADYVFTPPDQTSLEEIKEKIEYLESIQNPDAIKNAVDDYLANNPIMVKETDPTVPEWAKQPTPPDVKIPDKLPNPHSITFTGAVDASYDGSNPVEIKIPDSGGNVELYIGSEQPTNGAMYWLDISEDIPVVPDVPVEPDVPDEPEIVTYTITNNLTNVTNGNSASSVEENASYTATLTVADGYELDAVTVTMGGTDVTSTVYANGVVTIPAVTGNVVITATAKEIASGGVDLSEANVFASVQVASGGKAKIDFTSSTSPSRDDLMALKTEKLYFYFVPIDAYKKNIAIGAAYNSSYGSENLAAGITIAQATNGTYAFVTNAWDKYSESGYVVYEIDVAALQAKVQAMYDAGTLDSTKAKTVTFSSVQAAKAESIAYLLYNYNG